MHGICWQLNEGNITTINHLIQFNAYLVIECSWHRCVCLDFITSELPLGWSIYFIATIWLKFFLPSLTFGLVIASASKNQWSGEFLVCCVPSKIGKCTYVTFLFYAIALTFLHKRICESFGFHCIDALNPIFNWETVKELQTHAIHDHHTFSIISNCWFIALLKTFFCYILIIDFDLKTIKLSIKLNWHQWRIERERIVTNSI